MREIFVVSKAFSEAASATAADRIRARFKVRAALRTAEGVAAVAADPEGLNPT